MRTRNIISAVVAIILSMANMAHAQEASLSKKQVQIATIASQTAKSELEALEATLTTALDNGMTVNEAKEVMVHSYAYCGFPKALRGLQTLVAVLDERTAKGLNDDYGRDAAPVTDTRTKYERGREILSEISGVPADAPKAAYAVLAPEVEVFLKEHLFCDLFERDVLTYAERELATVAVIAALGEGVGPMLRSHIGIAKKLGATDNQIDEVLAIASPRKVTDVFERGAHITDNPNFNGEIWLQGFVSKEDGMDCTVANVTFAKGVRNNWHSHPGGQILLCTSGEGRYQEKGKPVQVLRPGDVVKIAPNVVHWHGAAPDSEFTHIAIGTQQSKGGAVWIAPVTDEEYNDK